MASRRAKNPKSETGRTRPNSSRRKRAANSASSQKLRGLPQIADISQDAIFLWRKPGGIEFWNKGAEDLYGFSAKEAVGSDSHVLLRTQFPIPLLQIEKALRKLGSWRGELQHTTRSGRPITVSTRLQLVPAPGKGMLVLESTRDITEAKQYEKNLQSRLHEQAVTARFSLDALQAKSIQSICDDATHILAHEMGADFSSLFEVSEDGKAMTLRSGFGWEPGCVGSTRIDVGENTAMGRALQLNQPIMIEDLRRDRQIRLPKYMREHKVVSSMAVVIQGRQRAFGVLGVDAKAAGTIGPEAIHFLESIGNVLATAISRLQFEHDLRDTAARLKGIVDTAVDGIITIDERGMVESMNPAAERIFGYRAGEVAGRNVSMLMPEPYRSEHDGYLERYRKTGERRIIGIGREVRGRRKDGSEFPMDLAVSATILGDRRIFTGLVRDITVRKRLEQEILEISDHERRRLGSDLHDDLCQRLAGIRFACDALRRTLDDSASADALRRLDKIGTDVGDAIERTRTLARGMTPVALEANGLVSAVQELGLSVEKTFGVKCTIHAARGFALNSPSAATHLYRMAQEAIGNAIRHGRATAVVISIRSDGSKGVLSIQDNGSGFSPAEAAHAGGMGLRSIAYRAGLIHAKIEVTSRPGQGARITCVFPIPM